MSRFSAFIFLLFLTVTISMVTASVIAPPPNETFSLDGGTVQMLTEVVPEEESDDTMAITPYGYRAVMLENVLGRKLTCWRCRSPCSAYACCNDGYPQCCRLNGRCKCCRR